MRTLVSLRTPEERAEERELTSQLAGRLQTAALSLASPTHISEVVPTVGDGAAFFIHVDGQTVAVLLMVQDETGPVMRG